MSHFNGSYLRVLTPRTIDGIVPKMGRSNTPMYKESHLPLSARKHLERKNKKLPQHLRHIIEVIDPISEHITALQETSPANVLVANVPKELVDEPAKKRTRKKSIEDELEAIENFENE